MDVILKTSQEELAKEFFLLKSAKDLASLLEIPYKVLNYHLFVARKKKQQYKVFSIPKKSGGVREICAPITTLKIMQQKLNLILQNAYKKKNSVHGFVYERNIVTNAQKHTQKQYLLNIDILDFFPSINFGRVYGMFKAKPYKLPGNVATVLAQICCFNNKIPQGAPTSPIVSNMVCARLDGELKNIAYKYECTYTRYADDITFSTNRPKFPEAFAIVSPSTVKQRLKANVGNELNEIIQNNGFSINPNKTWIQPAHYRQEVTGLTVNEFPNVRRKYINQIRAMLHAWQKYGLEDAQKEFIEKHDNKHRRQFEEQCLFKNVVKGKIDFLKMVRGPQNPTYLNLCGKLASLDPDFLPIFEKLIKKEELKDVFEEAVFVFECSDSQGTAFMLKDVGLVTCAHVLGKKKLFVFKSTNPDKHYPVKVVSKSDELDIAILDIVDKRLEHSTLLKGTSNTIKRGDSIKLVGFPKYGYGQTIQVFPGVIVGKKRPFGQERLNINATIICGNSGGPVLNDVGEVIGIAVTGTDKIENFPECEYGVIPIDTIDLLLKEE